MDTVLEIMVREVPDSRRARLGCILALSFSLSLSHTHTHTLSRLNRVWADMWSSATSTTSRPSVVTRVAHGKAVSTDRPASASA